MSESTAIDGIMESTVSEPIETTVDIPAAASEDSGNNNNSANEFSDNADTASGDSAIIAESSSNAEAYKDVDSESQTQIQPNNESVNQENIESADDSTKDSSEINTLLDEAPVQPSSDTQDISALNNTESNPEGEAAPEVSSEVSNSAHLIQENPQPNQTEECAPSIEGIDSNQSEQNEHGSYGDAFSTWTKQRAYLGGYRDKRNGTLFFNSEAQTTTPHEIRDTNRRAERFHRDTQTVYQRNRFVQGVRSTQTQMTTAGKTYISTADDKIIIPKQYVTALEWEAHVTRNVIRIQCWVRCVFAKRLLRQLQAQRDERNKKIAEREKKRQDMEENRRNKELEAQLHPKTKRDFERLYHGLEVWRLQETEKINSKNLPHQERLDALAELLNQEASLIQQIDHLKVDVNVEIRERKIQSFLDKVSQPKKWPVHSSKALYTLVDTPMIIRARELKDLYVALSSTHTTINNRLQVLLHVKYTVKEFDCRLTRNIVNLIDREADLLKRDRNTKSLEGLRLRISNLFFQFIKTPEFNPEAASLQKFPNESQGWQKNQPVYYCRGCTKYLPCTSFYLSATMKQLGRCKSCVMQENIATARRNELVYSNMLRTCRLQEEKKRLDSMLDDYIFDTQNVINLLQESDLEYILSVMWHNSSAISGSKNMDNLVLTRWNVSEELSPWNCILLTNKEAIAHDAQKNPTALYGKEFCEKVHQKLILARQHFQQLPWIAQYLQEHYTETAQGYLVPIHKPKPLQSCIIPSGTNINNKFQYKAPAIPTASYLKEVNSSSSQSGQEV